MKQGSGYRLRGGRALMAAALCLVSTGLGRGAGSLAIHTPERIQRPIVDGERITSTPDRRFTAYRVIDCNGFTSGHTDLRVVDALGRRQYPDFDRGWFQGWTPDSRGMIYSGDGSSYHVLWLSTGRSEQVYPPGERGRLHGATGTVYLRVSDVLYSVSLGRDTARRLATCAGTGEIRICPDGRTLACDTEIFRKAGSAPFVALIDVRSGRRLRLVPGEVVEWLDRRTLLVKRETSGEARTWHLLDIRNGRLRSVYKGQPQWVELSPSRRWLAVADARTLTLVATRNGQRLRVALPEWKDLEWGPADGELYLRNEKHWMRARLTIGH